MNLEARVRGLLIVSCAALAGLAVAASAQGQSWPQRPVKLLVPFAAGGNIDVLGRLMAQRLSEALGQQFIVENRVGGNGIIATEAAARAPADGYTLLWASTSVIAIFPAITKVPYDPVKDLEPISLLGTSPQVLIINPKLPINNVAEFVAYVRAQPNKMPYAGGGGPGSASNLMMSLFLKRAGLDMTNVTYRGTAPALTDLIAGHIPTMFIPVPEAVPHAKSGSIRMLAVTSGTRTRQLPDVPSLAESGFPGFHTVSWTGLMAPTGTPKDIVQRLATEFTRAVKEPKLIEQLETAGVDPQAEGPDQFRMFIASEIKLWADAVKTAGVTLQ